jgi:hypothetical protein
LPDATVKSRVALREEQIDPARRSIAMMSDIPSRLWGAE